ncbi:alpha/beta hydrolase [Rhodococcus ruber]|uniref:Alpha/beta hydrolase n=1 Tax=Rhodococcus ruber TaxID=1830 RepID=A0ABT4MD15_9NOCA|nr:alpha/beta hydrolase [Rhodococcus ruber]MCZ4518862.1 alpha/beta hydrolase [Rhodococcus ruber]
MRMTTAKTVTTRNVTVGDHRLLLNEAGDPSRPAVLFLHGSGPGATGMSNWSAVLGDLSDDYYCLAPDVLGFGDSTHPNPPPQGLAAFTTARVDSLIALLDVLCLERVTPVGNSMGGIWSLELARRIPDRLDKIVLMGSGGAPIPAGPSIPALAGFYQKPSTEAMTALLEAFVYDPSLFGNELRQVAERRMAHVSRPDVTRSHVATFAGLNASDPWSLTPDEAAAITHEVLIVHGREDRFVTFDSALWFFEHLANARLYGIGKCGHWTQIEQHQRFVTALREFLSDRL